MTQALAVRQDVAHDMALDKLGAVMASSGFFKDSRSAAQAIVKIIAGREMGIGAVTAMTGIHIIEGKVAIGAGLLAAAIKRSGRYNYRVLALTDTEASVEILEDGKLCGTSTFTMKDATAAGISGKGVWKSYPRNMLFARAISNAVRFYCPDVTGGPMYTPEELGAEVNADGDAINVAVVEPVPAATPAPTPAPAPKSAPEASSQATEAPAGDGERFGVIEKVFVKNGEKNGKPWTKYGVQISGETFGTFDHTDGANAQDWQGQEVAFTVKPSRDPKYTDLVSLRRVNPDADTTHQMTPEDEQFMFGTQG